MRETTWPCLPAGYTARVPLSFRLPYFMEAVEGLARDLVDVLAKLDGRLKRQLTSLMAH